jgi:hypothetical protein
MISGDPIGRGSVFDEFRDLLLRKTNGNVRFYVGIRSAGEKSKGERIEVATSRFS